MENLCSLVFLLFFFPLLPLQSAAASEYVRQPPRPLILTHHNRSESDPQQVHISLAGKDHVRVSWVSGAHRVPSVVEYGKTPGRYEASAAGESTKYQYFFYSSGKIHHVKIGPLEPATTYYYRCGESGPDFSFRTPPATFPIEFAVVGDLGQTEWTASTLTHVNASDYDVFLLPGDLSYADSQQPLWDSFGRLVEPYASRRPWMVTEGNHEIETFPIIYPHGFKSYNARWPMPYRESGSKSNLYYSFNVAGVHVIMLGSYTDFDAGSEQYKWLEADLAGVDRRETPWLIVLLHAPWVYDNKADPCGPVHITIGDGGNREGLAFLFEKPSPSISEFQEPSFGHGRLRILDGKRAHWSWHRNDDSDCVVADELWLESLSSSRACMPTSSAEDLQGSSASAATREEL
ncbi:Acid phosphatase [Bertholletia excelsa]